MSAPPAEPEKREFYRRGFSPPAGTLVEGPLLFPGNARTVVRGSVIRLQNCAIALHMPDSEIPFAILRGEERHLLSHYRTWAKLRLWPPLEPGL
ncbi:MAG: hypothetical protein WBQ93_05940 [Candidatus Competibacter sp.]|nr:hypothetical protein [Candidatus Competibacteraceae bacterium]